MTSCLTTCVAGWLVIEDCEGDEYLLDEAGGLLLMSLLIEFEDECLAARCSPMFDDEVVDDRVCRW